MEDNFFMVLDGKSEEKRRHLEKLLQVVENYLKR